MTLANLAPGLLGNPTAVLATNGHDGHSQLTAVWYIVEDDRICISITESTRKAQNLAADGRCSVLIFHPEIPNYYAEIRPSHRRDLADHQPARLANAHLLANRNEQPEQRCSGRIGRERHTVTDAVASKRSSCKMRTGRGLPT